MRLHGLHDVALLLPSDLQLLWHCTVPQFISGAHQHTLIRSPLSTPLSSERNALRTLYFHLPFAPLSALLFVYRTHAHGQILHALSPARRTRHG